jgi:hypothetical protein
VDPNGLQPPTIHIEKISVVGIATSYRLDGRGIGVRVPVGSRIFSSPHRPERLCGPPNLLSNGYQGFFPLGLSARGVKLPTHLQLVPRSSEYISIHSLSNNIFLIGIVGVGVQLDPLGTAATNWPIVLVPGDYDDGEIGGMIGKGNRSTRRKPAPVPLCPPRTHMLPGREPGPPRWEASDNRYSPISLHGVVLN